MSPSRPGALLSVVFRHALAARRRQGAGAAVPCGPDVSASKWLTRRGLLSVPYVRSMVSTVNVDTRTPSTNKPPSESLTFMIRPAPFLTALSTNSPPALVQRSVVTSCQPSCSRARGNMLVFQSALLFFFFFPFLSRYPPPSQPARVQASRGLYFPANEQGDAADDGYKLHLIRTCNINKTGAMSCGRGKVK